MFTILPANMQAYFMRKSKEKAHEKVQEKYKSEKENYAELADVSNIENTDMQFDAELQVYKSMEGVSVDTDVTSKYANSNQSIIHAKKQIKTSSNYIKQQLKTLRELEYNSTETSFFKLYQKVHQAKKKYDKTMPFSQEAKSAKQEFLQALMEKDNAIAASKKNDNKIQECTAKIEEEQRKITEQKNIIDKAIATRENIISQVRPQFKIVEKIRAQYIFLKNVADFNDTEKYEALPDDNPQKKAFVAAKAFVEAYEAKGNNLTISLDNPVREYTEDDLKPKDTVTQTENGLEINLQDELNPILLASKNLDLIPDNLQIDTIAPNVSTPYKEGIIATQKSIANRNKGLIEKVLKNKEGLLLPQKSTPTRNLDDDDDDKLR